MIDLPTFSLDEIAHRLTRDDLPFSGITELGTTEFHITEPAHFIGVALHTGRQIREDILDQMVVAESDRYREEDPFTDHFIKDFPVRIIALDSRFEYDLNREPERSIYSSVRGIWGLDIWRSKVVGQMWDFTLQKHKEFYDLLDLIVEYLLGYFEKLFVYDMHAYCYQREKKQLWFENPRPEINLGTKAVNHELFAPVIDAMLKMLGECKIDGRQIRVTENEIFPGGYLSRRLSKANYDRVLVLAVEYKKLFMDEWSGELYDEKLQLLINNFEETVEIINSLPV